jgi:signal transduction histidine kinase
MTIRTRLTFWYAGIMSASLLAMALLTYYKFAPEPRSGTPGAEEGRKPDEDDEVDYRESLEILIWCGLPAALLGLVGGGWLMRRALEPVAALTRAAQRIQESNLHEQLPRTGNGDELDRLTEVFNAMTSRLGVSFQRIRDFTLHASHELKTPLAVMQGELETALREEPLTPAQRERLLSQLDEVQRLGKIVDSLTLLTKADAGEVVLNREPIHLADLVREAFEDAQVLAKAQGVRVQLAACEEVTLPGDRHRLRQLLLNLTDNAIKYNCANGSVTLALRRLAGEAELTIQNTGPGIPPELLARVFDRFFRGDPSHSHAVEGCGLGLSIARWIVQAHGGSIQLTSTPNKLTTVTVRWPASTPGSVGSCSSGSNRHHG